MAGIGMRVACPAGDDLWGACRHRSGVDYGREYRAVWITPPGYWNQSIIITKTPVD